MSKFKFTKIVKELNIACIKYNEAMVIIAKHLHLNKDMEVYYWRIKKNMNELNKIMAKELPKLDINMRFDDIKDKFNE